MKRLVISMGTGALFMSTQTFGMSLTGDVNMVHPPASVQQGDRTNSNKAILFTEQANTALGGNLRVDAFLPGKYSDGVDTKGRTIGAGKVVSSFLLHADPGDAKSGRMKGSIHFNDKILGVVFGDLSASNALVGAPETTYAATPGHGLDGKDFFKISKNRKRLDFNFNVGDITDQIRIITRGTASSPGTDGAGSALPEPVTPTLLAMGLSGLALRRRRVDK